MKKTLIALAAMSAFAAAGVNGQRKRDCLANDFET